MIIFDLVCEHRHRFEGWFASSGEFDTQRERGLIACPQCGSPTVTRVPSAVAIATHRAGPETAITENKTASASPGSSTHFLGALRQLTQTILNHSEDVGTAFAAEARRIHYGDAPERSIRGQATADEATALEEEGIEFVRVPVIRSEDLN